MNMRLFLVHHKPNKLNVYLFTPCFLLLSIIGVLTGCGKKQKNIFVFDKVKRANVSVLGLPSVKGVVVTHEAEGVRISWYPVSLDGITPNDLCFRGYNVYRLTRAGIIPKKPLNKLFLIDTSFVDRHAKGQPPTAGYLIKAVFSVAKETFYAPASRIAKIR